MYIDKNKPIVIALCGKSCAGKDTLSGVLCSYLRMLGVPAIKIISDTTRPPRPQEEDGVDYNFITKEQFKDGIRKDIYAEWQTYRSWYYGSNVDSFSMEAVNVGVFNIDGIINLIAFGYNVIPIYLDVPFFERMKRYKKRAGKITFEQFRRAFVDMLDFLTIDVIRYSQQDAYLVLKNLDLAENCCKITQHLVSIGVLPSKILGKIAEE